MSNLAPSELAIIDSVCEGPSFKQVTGTPYPEQFRSLALLLLQHAGRDVMYPGPENGLRLLKSGKLFQQLPIKIGGWSEDAVVNALKLNLRDPTFKIYGGFALNGDGVWRKHLWTVRNGQTFESTAFRSAYFGAPLTNKEVLELRKGIVEAAQRSLNEFGHAEAAG